MIVETPSGAKYHLDFEAKTWERRQEFDEHPVPVRTNHGTFLRVEGLHSPVGMIIWCPPLVEGTAGRMIQTSGVVSVEYRDFEMDLYLKQYELPEEKDACI